MGARAEPTPLRMWTGNGGKAAGVGMEVRRLADEGVAAVPDPTASYRVELSFEP